MLKTLEERFWEKVDVKGRDECWEWLAAKTSGGYGHLKVEGNYPQAHRLSFEMVVGEIPEGMVLDHLCRNRACVNPNHLEPVTCRENLLRGEGTSAKNANKTHCPKGHIYDEENTVVYKGSRYCKKCRKQRNDEANALRKKRADQDAE